MHHLISIREAVFEESKKLEEDIFSFKFSISGSKDFIFKAGQYVVLQISGNIRRSYSIASAPSLSENKFELIADIIPDGAGSTYLMGLKTGQKISFLGPAGNFGLSEELDNDLFFICTGAGLAPIKSMIEELVVTEKYREHKIHLIFGTRTKDRILCEDNFEKLQKDGVIDSYNIYLSRDKTPGKYNFGYVTEFVKNSDSVLLRDGNFFICGNLDMVKSVREALENKGVDSSKIRFEAFG